MTERPTSGSSPKAEVLRVSPKEVVATLGNVLVIIVFEPPTEDVIELCIRAARSASRATGALGAFVFVAADGRPPDEAERARIKRLVVEISSVCRGLGCCIDGEGFVAASKRSVMTLLTMTLRTPVPLKVFGSRADAGAWVLKQLGAAAPPGVSGTTIADLSLELLSRAARGDLKTGAVVTA